MTTDAKPDFNLDAAVKEARREPFRFVFAGKPWVLRPMMELDAWVIGSADQSAEGFDTILKAAMEPKDYERFRKLSLPLGAIAPLLTAYEEHSGLAEGEDEASTS